MIYSPETWCDNDGKSQSSDNGVDISALSEGHETGPGAVVTKTNQ